MLRFEKQDLLSMLNKVSRGASKEHPNLKLYVNSGESKMYLETNSVSIGMRGTVALEEPAEETFSAVVDFKNFVYHVRCIDGGIKKKGNRLISRGGVVNTIVQENAYVDAPKSEWVADVTVPQVIFKDLTKDVREFTSTDKFSVLRAANIIIKNEEIKVVASDRYQVSIRREDFPDLDPATDVNVMIDGISLSGFSSVLSDSDLNSAAVQIRIGKNQYSIVSTDGIEIFGQLVSGKYPNVEEVVNRIKEESTYNITVDRNVLLEKAACFSTLADDDFSISIASPVRLLANKSFITIEANNALSEVKKELSASITGFDEDEKIRISFNGKYLVNVVKSCPEDTIDFRITKKNHVLTFLTEDTTHLIMPKVA